jgi:hypothetical protein
MSVYEYARREEKQARIEREIAKLLGTPTSPKSGLDAIEEIATMLVDAAILLRDAAALARSELRDARKEEAA